MYKWEMSLGSLFLSACVRMYVRVCVYGRVLLIVYERRIGYIGFRFSFKHDAVVINKQSAKA